MSEQIKEKSDKKIKKYIPGKLFECQIIEDHKAYF